MSEKCWSVTEGDEPLLATAVHDGHELRDEVAALQALGAADRLREEDPFTGQWTRIAANRLVARRSRFEVDLNRAREIAVYIRPEDAWGLKVWKQEPPRDLVDRSLAEFDGFYAEVRGLCEKMAERFGKFVVFDLHSYNHMRNGPDGPAADPSGNPEVNIGTGTMDRERWAPLVDRFIADLRAFNFLGRHLDVRENVKFRGKEMPTWVHTNFPQAGCAMAIEFKKFFMDEWTGEVHREQYEAIPRALQSCIPGLKEELRKLGAAI